ncbi:MAG: helix-turn-helix transcriptional regulator [Marinilabiliaceae bacterium]|nr:helix-turn-helix transcriptional regulator [Marinilabiliaceae bacterium]
MKRLGERIRKKRELLSLPLGDLAKKVGISSSALSQIEKAKAFPSIVTLKSIADNLHVTVGELIGENEALSQNPLVKAHDISFVERNATGTELLMLSHHDQLKHMEPYLLRFVPDSDVVGLFHPHNGQTFCHVLEGDFVFTLDEVDYAMGKGDNFYFNTVLPFRVKYIGKATGLVLWVMSPPNG